ncbi:Rpn family recombination-promoting nuclease/putative transposase [Massilia rubra]|uniref:Transposase n=1 Tax=Massilia rubra TaxID=2607910 RepID=A0ABX0LHB4_9BURK|nr:Rpn family recombination-promoting nuclease/putative transposase [Massilia rubra]NHZ33657.1 transposase [Massilia rubra]
MTTQSHDLGYRALFAHPEMVRELITGFTPFKLLDGVALSAFKRINTDYVSERPSARQGDLVWRVQLGDEFLYVYILLECQSGVDRWMALRMQTYVGLLCQDLVKRHELSPGLRLPPLLPLVLYNGGPRWNASIDLAELLMEAPAGLAALQPSQRYVLIDQQRLDPAALEANDDLLALLFRIELSHIPDVLHTHLRALLAWFRDTPQTSLRTSVWAWWKTLAARRNDNQALFDIASLEDADMDATMINWAEELREIGRQEGLALAGISKEEMRAEGRAQGRAEGRAEGQVMALRATLEKVLRIRFGAVPEQAVQRLDRATQEELETWIERSVTAPSLAGLFGADAAPPV